MLLLNVDYAGFLLKHSHSFSVCYHFYFCHLKPFVGIVDKKLIEKSAPSSHILEVVYQNLLLLPTYILLPVISPDNITYNNLSRSISVNKIMNAALV